MNKELQNEFEFYEGKELYEAFYAFIGINPGFPRLFSKRKNEAKRHYVKQDLGLDFIYNCNFFGIKVSFIDEDLISFPYLDCTVTKYYYSNGNKIVESSINFRFDCIKEKIMPDLSINVQTDNIIKKYEK